MLRGVRENSALSHCHSLRPKRTGGNVTNSHYGCLMYEWLHVDGVLRGLGYVVLPMSNRPILLSAIAASLVLIVEQFCPCTAMWNFSSIRINDHIETISSFTYSVSCDMTCSLAHLLSAIARHFLVVDDIISLVIHVSSIAYLSTSRPYNFHL